ncbi:DUF6088 family protein [Deinococcus cellulosilyticus]|uniref:Uncharacterized protein n=1 Tax=Deinococcus cellulosilyticus (strain DSM 18568 / NBRC 106333 / KACC 11606 / 5516J-15) TaxID=1223518 RepID=A0A511NBE4_DEIC1|nr:DUF6088 family protein [Deinococcus cellulosilyticus]GEM50140.1 hypothetical protein DC3_57750 [Deinococcus cellulosilyticus NBRC 106333 = KACC 11606]
MESLRKRTIQYVHRLKKGTLFSVGQLAEKLGVNNSRVYTVLSRMVQEKDPLIIRASHGLYQKPERSRWVGIVPPKPELVVQHWARKHQCKVRLAVEALLVKWQLTTQHQMQRLMETTGPSTTLNINGVQVHMRHRSEGAFVLHGTAAGEVVAVLMALGKRNVTQKVLHTLKRRLPDPEIQLIVQTPQVPLWIRQVLHSPGDTG